MRAIDKSTFLFQDVYDICVADIKDETVRNNMSAIFPNVMHDGIRYDSLAEVASLHLLLKNKSKNDQIIVGAVTKQQLKDLYTTYMVKMPNGRAIYDKILLSAQNGVCPLCACGYVRTLDHYLPKSFFPTLSVHPWNLVPACRDCNTTKLASVRGEDEMSIHPYYDDPRLFSERWLFARVVQSSPISVDFFVSPPTTWSEILRSRVKAHFEDFDLSKKFRVAAVDEIASSSDVVSTYFHDIQARQKFLRQKANSYEKKHINSWQGAVADAMASDNWYLTTGCFLR